MPDHAAPTEKKKLGEYLLEDHALTDKQLNEALRLHSKGDGPIGSKLVEMNYIEAKSLVKALAKQLGQPVVNLLDMQLDPRALKLLSLEQMKKYQALPVGFYNKKVVLAITTPDQKPALDELPYLLEAQIKPVIVPAYQLLLAFDKLSARELASPDKGLASEELAPVTRFPRIWELCKLLIKHQASDLLLVAGAIPSLKKNNELVRLEVPLLPPGQMETYANELMSRQQQEEFRQNKDIDFALTEPSLGRFRINIYRQRTSISIAIRHIVEDIPTLAQLNLPNWLENYALKPQGLILISGPNGHGKSTTMAAIIDIINTKCKRNIITIEDPIEYLHQHKNSNVNQREVGLDTKSFQEGLRHIYREAPDVIMIGEMRDRESIAIALEAADTGHLVISSLHANNSTMAVNRIIDVFPADQQAQIRVHLADNLLLSFNQRLLKCRTGEGRVPAYGKLTNSHRVANMIREGKDHHIRSQLVAGEEFVPLDFSLAQLVKEKRVDREVARHYSLDPKLFAELIKQ